MGGGGFSLVKLLKANNTTLASNPEFILLTTTILPHFYIILDRGEFLQRSFITEVSQTQDYSEVSPVQTGPRIRHLLRLTRNKETI